MRVGGLLERDGVIASVDELLRELADGHSAALYVLGEAGLGKTSVLDHACGRSRAAGLARAELKVAGGRPGRRAASRQLTAQEGRVARLAATGATNAEIGSQLYLSVSTIETHLEHISAKLGIHSRYELIAKAADGSWDS